MILPATLGSSSCMHVCRKYYRSLRSISVYQDVSSRKIPLDFSKSRRLKDGGRALAWVSLDIGSRMGDDLPPEWSTRPPPHCNVEYTYTPQVPTAWLRLTSDKVDVLTGDHRVYYKHREGQNMIRKGKGKGEILHSQLGTVLECLETRSKWRWSAPT